MSQSGRVVFIAERKNYYRVFGPVVDAALRDGWAVECWHDWGQPRWGTKASEFPDSAPSFRWGAPAIEQYSGKAELASRLLAAPPHAVVALGPPPAELAQRVRWIGLQHMTSLVNPFGPAGLAACDAIAGYSDFWLGQALEYFRAAGEPVNDETARAIRQKFAPVGVPEMDQVEMIDPSSVRERLGLPPDRPVVLFLPYPVKSNPPTFWLRHVYRPVSRARRALAVVASGKYRYWPHVARDWNDARVVRAVRRFCDANDALLVVKSRLKDPVPRHTAALADLVLYDPSHYPATILELASVAALCVHFWSSAVYESVFMNVPSLSIATEAHDMGLSPQYADTLFHARPGGSYNWPGASYSRTVAEVVDELPSARIKDFSLDPVARAEFVRAFLGHDDTKSSERVLALLASRGGER